MRERPSPDFWEKHSWQWMWVFILIGIALRVAQFASNRSLWLDEALLALNVLHRSFGGLLNPLDYHQGAPFGFLLLEKLITKLAGGRELALRSLPLGFGILALLTFPRVARSYVSTKAVPVAFSLLALGGPLIYYSSEAKQYSSDVAVTIMLLWVVSKVEAASFSNRQLVASALLGCGAVWFSHPAAFVLTGCGVTLLSFAFFRRDWPRLVYLSIVCGLWGLSFAAYYLISLHPLSTDQALLNFWRNYFPPGPFWSLTSVSFLIDRFFGLFDDPVQVLSVVGTACFVMGCARLARRNPIRLWLLTAPLIVAVIAAFAHLYPLGGRLFLFAVPILLMLIGEGVRLLDDSKWRFVQQVQIVLVVLLLAKPVWMDARTLVHPQRPEDIRLAIQYIQSHQQEDDVWFVYHWARYQFLYYSEVYYLQPPAVRIGADCGVDRTCYVADIEELRGQPRVWVLFSHLWVGDGLQEEPFFIQQLDRMGVRLDKFQSTGARAYLYDLRQSAKDSGEASLQSRK